MEIKLLHTSIGQVRIWWEDVTLSVFDTNSIMQFIVVKGKLRVQPLYLKHSDGTFGAIDTVPLFEQYVHATVRDISPLPIYYLWK